MGTNQSISCLTIIYLWILLVSIYYLGSSNSWLNNLKAVFLVMSDPSMNELWGTWTHWDLCIDLSRSLTARSWKGRTRLKIQPHDTWCWKLFSLLPFFKRSTVITTVLLQECGFLFFHFNVNGISNQSLADASSFKITRLPLLMPMVCQGFVFWMGEGDREEGKKERYGISNIYRSLY